MQFQPTALILAASAQREHFDSVRLDTAGSDAAPWHFESFDPGRISDPIPAREHRVRRSLAAVLVRAAGAIEPRPAQRTVVRG